jgi:exonuclease SbcD
VKLLCCGDFHLGAGAEYGPRPGDRLRDQERVLNEIVRIAHEENVDAVLFAGDAFERRRPSPEEIHVWQEFVYEATCHSASLVSIDGNHDVIAADVFAAPELAIGMDHYRTPGVEELCSHKSEAERAYVATLPWTPPAHLVANRNGGDRDELHAEVADLLLDAARDLRSQIPVGRPSILLAHWSVSGAVTPTGADVGLFREPVLPLADLLALGFDWIVLGHIHETQILARDPVVMRSENGTEAVGNGTCAFYVGSPMVLNFGEAKGHHGVMLLDTDARSLRHIEIPDRPFVTVDADIPIALANPVGIYPITDPTDLIAAAVAEHLPLTDAVVRIRYKATAEQARRVDHAALRGLVADAGASKLYAIQPEIVRTDRARVEGVDEQVGPMEALDLWIEHNFQEVARGDELRVLTSRYLEDVAA